MAFVVETLVIEVVGDRLAGLVSALAPRFSLGGSSPTFRAPSAASSPASLPLGALFVSRGWLFVARRDIGLVDQLGFDNVAVEHVVLVPVTRGDLAFGNFTFELVVLVEPRLANRLFTPRLASLRAARAARFFAARASGLFVTTCRARRPLRSLRVRVARARRLGNWSSWRLLGGRGLGGRGT
jgi:hypothetical protein